MANPAPAQVFGPVKQLENPTTWRPGVSGNPNGRPPVPKCITDQLRNIALRPDAPNAASLAQALWTKGQTGDTFAIKEILDRLEGRVPNPITITSTSVNLEIAAQYSDLAGNLRQGLAAGVFGQLVEIEGPDPSTDVPSETPGST